MRSYTNMKKILSAVLALGMMISSAVVFAQKEVTVNHNGQKIAFDVNPYIDADTTMVPMRGIFEAVGAEVSWDEETKTVIAAYLAGGEQTFVLLQIGSNFAFVNGEKTEFEKSAVIVGDRTFVPLRFVMESLGHKVTWDADTYTVDIISE